MSSNFQSSFSETANEILALAMSLKQSFEAEESEYTDSFDVGAEPQNSNFVAASETSKISRKRKKNYKIPVPKRRKEEVQIDSRISQSESTRNNLYNNIQSSSESEKIAEVDKIRIMQVNAHGALTSNKLGYLKEVILLHKPDIILVNEFGQPKDHPIFPKIETFEAVSFDLKATFSGVAIYVQASLLKSVELVQVNHGLEFSQIAGIQIQGLKIFTIYRSPRRHEENVKLKEQELLCRWIQSLPDDQVLIIGDLNLHVCWETYESKNPVHKAIAQELLSKHFIQYQINSTFHNSDNILDVTLCNSMDTILRCTVDKFSQIDGIDHFLTITDIALRCSKIVEKEVLKRKNRDKEKYQQLVSAGVQELLEKHIESYETDGPNITLVENMVGDLAKLLLKSEQETVPKVKIKVDEFKTRSFNTFSTRTRSLYKYKYKLLAKGSVTRAGQLQKKIDDSFAKDKAQWCQKFINDLKRDPNHIWSVVKKATVTASSTGGLQKPDGTLTFNKIEKVKLLSDRYASVLTPKTFPTCNVDDLSTCQTTPRLGDVAFTSGEMTEVLKMCNPSMAIDSRGLYVPLFRDVREDISLYLALVYNMCIQLSYIAVPWLTAMVIPIPKPGDLTIPKNWRGIVLEQSDLRIFEKGLNYQIVSYLEEILFFHPAQSGFRWKRSCIHNLISYWTYLVGLMSDYETVDVIYADTSAAFDRLSHGILLDKLFHRCGIYGNLWKILEAWCTNRSQFVRWNGVDSEEIEVTSSCMQGSCLGTTLWNVYFNDILIKIEEWIDELAIEGASFYAYADDIKIIYPAIDENYPKINELMRRLQKEMDDNHLKFNPEKFKILTLGDVNPKLDVKMTDENGQEVVIQRSTSERDLGILVDSDGTFKSQVSRSLSISKATVKILGKIFVKCAFEDKLKLYHAYVFSRMSYGSEIWISTDRKIMDDFNQVYIDLFQFTVVQHGHWPPYVPEQLFLEKDLLMLYDIFHHRSPVYHNEIFTDLPPSPQKTQTRSQTQERVKTKRWNKWTNTLLVERNRNVWNSIPIEIRKNPSRFKFQEFIRKEVLEKLPCNKIRDDMLSGSLREKALRRLAHIKQARRISEINLEIENTENAPLNDFLVDDSFRDDFLSPNLCLKKMKPSNQKKIQDLAKIAPWMLLCKCGSQRCNDEIIEYETKNNCKLRDLGKTVIVDDKVITKNKHLMTTTKKLQDLLDEIDEKTIEDFYD